MLQVAAKILLLFILAELGIVLAMFAKSFLFEYTAESIKRERQDLMVARSLLHEEIEKRNALKKQIDESCNCGSDCGNGSKK